MFSLTTTVEEHGRWDWTVDPPEMQTAHVSGLTTKRPPLATSQSSRRGWRDELDERLWRGQRPKRLGARRTAAVVVEQPPPPDPVAGRREADPEDRYRSRGRGLLAAPSELAGSVHPSGATIRPRGGSGPRFRGRGDEDCCGVAGFVGTKEYPSGAVRVVLAALRQNGERSAWIAPFVRISGEQGGRRRSPIIGMKTVGGSCRTADELAGRSEGGPRASSDLTFVDNDDGASRLIKWRERMELMAMQQEPKDAEE
ncbi:hypothetical protein THAOC_05360 [Thalassiosira oceanica]|uniref:Uncharacterized protein n=1 Tax=Thalassiosira oceanica TaxID=159749 RepID=K0TMW6_THAOC|nr:hypothetical protein THAOC_05360 [Thalassiosira oceanica]|eukprot:EJK73042.1 hypothetical protein THAOC_05360 [Thalassiosira oceanica]